MMLPQVVEDLLGSLYNKDEVEELFNFSSLLIHSEVTANKVLFKFDIPQKPTYDDTRLNSYAYYHEYLLKRGITEDTAVKYNIGFDSINNQITFPIRTIDRYCIGIGRRSINKKIYRYPSNMKKPLYRSI